MRYLFFKRKNHALNKPNVDFGLSLKRETVEAPDDAVHSIFTPPAHTVIVPDPGVSEAATPGAGSRCITGRRAGCV